MINPYAEFMSAVKWEQRGEGNFDVGLSRYVVVSDLDSTLRDTSPRHHLSPRRNPRSTWEDYSRACGDDLPKWGAIGVLVLASALGVPVHITTSASEAGRKQTEKWLYRHRVPFDVLDMRPVGTALLPQGEEKVAYVETLTAQALKPILILEDWPEAARMVTARTGVPVLLTNPDYSSHDTEARGM